MKKGFMAILGTLLVVSAIGFSAVEVADMQPPTTGTNLTTADMQPPTGSPVLTADMQPPTTSTTYLS